MPEFRFLARRRRIIDQASVFTITAPDVDTARKLRHAAAQSASFFEIKQAYTKPRITRLTHRLPKSIKLLPFSYRQYISEYIQKLNIQF